MITDDKSGFLDTENEENNSDSQLGSVLGFSRSGFETKFNPVEDNSGFVTTIIEGGKTILQGSNFSDVQLNSNGAMSDLYLRTYNDNGKREIVKRIKFEYKDNPKYRELFKKEYENLKGLNHKNIVEANNFGEDNQGLWYSMMYIEGDTLTDIIKKNSKTDGEKIQILKQILEGLIYIHEKDVVHRDLKPDNIMVTYNNNVRIIDFGLSVSMAFEENLKFAGTLKYMSPEQKINSSKVDNRADIYSFGLIMAELLSGKFVELSKISCIQNEEYRNIVEKCTKVEVSERFNNCNEIKK